MLSEMRGMGHLASTASGPTWVRGSRLLRRGNWSLIEEQLVDFEHHRA
jgi:hypothetical protein